MLRLSGRRMARERNGYIDDGHSISNASKRCPNCQSTDYTETISLERCKTCGLEFDYWGINRTETMEQVLKPCKCNGLCREESLRAGFRCTFSEQLARYMPDPSPKHTKASAVQTERKGDE